MSMPTTSGLLNGSSDPNSSPGSLHSQKHENSAPRSISDPMSPTRTLSWHPSPKKSWEQSYFSFQTSTRTQCPHVHYHPWCDDCQTLMEWEPLLPISPTRKRLMPTFGDLKRAVQERSCYQSPSGTQTASKNAIKKVCSTWREEQFTKAIAKRSAKMAAREALRQSAHQQ